jgi:hypothetical protein
MMLCVSAPVQQTSYLKELWLLYRLFYVLNWFCYSPEN